MFNNRCQICADYWVREGRPMRHYLVLYGGGHIQGAHDPPPPPPPGDDHYSIEQRRREAGAAEQMIRLEAEAGELRSRELEAEIAGLKGEVGRLSNEVAHGRGELMEVKAALRASQQGVAALGSRLDRYGDEMRRVSAWVGEVERRPTVSMGGERHVEDGYGQIGQINIEGGELRLLNDQPGSLKSTKVMKRCGDVQAVAW